MQTLSERRALHPELDRAFARLDPPPSFAEIMRESEAEERRALGGFVCALVIAVAVVMVIWSVA